MWQTALVTEDESLATILNRLRFLLCLFSSHQRHPCAYLPPSIHHRSDTINIDLDMGLRKS